MLTASLLQGRLSITDTIVEASSLVHPVEAYFLLKKVGIRARFWITAPSRIQKGEQAYVHPHFVPEYSPRGVP